MSDTDNQVSTYAIYRSSPGWLQEQVMFIVQDTREAVAKLVEDLQHSRERYTRGQQPDYTTISARYVNFFPSVADFEEKRKARMDSIREQGIYDMANNSFI